MIRACSVSELPEGEALRLDGSNPVSVFHTEEGFYAIDDTCTHQDASLADGWLEGCLVECPLHAAMFDLRTGVPTCLPAKKAVRTYPVMVTDGEVWVDVPAQSGEEEVA